MVHVQLRASAAAAIEKIAADGEITMARVVGEFCERAVELGWAISPRRIITEDESR